MTPVVVGAVFLAALLSALGLIAYFAYRGNNGSAFFSEAVSVLYELELSDAEIDSYYEIKDQLMEKYAPDVKAIAEAADTSEEGSVKTVERWTPKVPQEERANLQKALMRRLVSCIGKLDQVQRDKPGNWKLWQSKLITERFWSSLQDAEKMVSTEIDSCIAEAEEIQQGWGAHIFGQGVQCYRMQKQHEYEKQAKEKQVVEEKKASKKAVVDEKKQKVKEVRRKVTEKKEEENKKIMEEKNAQKMMEKLLAEEEAAAAKKSGKTNAATAKPKAKKK